MLKNLNNLAVQPASAFAYAILCSSCAGASLDLGAEAQPKAPPEVQTETRASQPEHSHDKQAQPFERAPLRAVHPGTMHVSMDHAAQTLTVEVTFDPCKSGGFVYEQDSLNVEVDHKERRVTLKGVVEYVEQIHPDPAACESHQIPRVFVSENAEPDAYLITNMSAWLGRGGNGLKARVKDFRTAEQVETDQHDCRAHGESDIGNISGVWFLQSDPAKAITLSGNAASINPEAVLRTWVGSSRPLWIKADQPYAFSLPSFGRTVFQSSSCALIHPPNSDEPTDILIRQTPEGL